MFHVGDIVRGNRTGHHYRVSKTLPTGLIDIIYLTYPKTGEKVFGQNAVSYTLLTSAPPPNLSDWFKK